MRPYFDTYYWTIIINNVNSFFIMDQPKIERVLRLMQLMSGTRYYTIEELAERLDTSSRSVYRYIDTFKSVGFVVKKVKGVPRLVKMDKRDDISQLVHFTDEEAYVVNRLIDVLDNGNVLKQSLRRKLRAVYDCSSVADCIVHGKEAENVHALIEAIEKKRQVKLVGYASSHSGVVRDRWVEPFDFTTDYNQVWCYDLEDKRNKLFKTIRIGEVEILEDGWMAEAMHERGFVDIFRFSGPERYRVKMELDVRARNVMVECFPLSEKYIEQVEDGMWLLDTEVCGMMGVQSFVLTTEGARIVESERVGVRS